MELVTANPKTKTLTMTSIPRDMLVKVTHDGDVQYVKINASYPIGGAKLAKHQVSELLGVPVDYYALVNMGVMEKNRDGCGWR
ncbi:LCP family protein [Limosilactobacillus equigenerosi]|uniref:LCP family protein n=1 Tax=Limosilactobacillus equigenerosi TaxID=417373 RepID=UPI0006D17FA4|nr:LCP family protein [Limosilactobacillus equigenerosi]